MTHQNRKGLLDTGVSLTTFFLPLFIFLWDSHNSYVGVCFDIPPVHEPLFCFSLSSFFYF